jgi:hypothetical protein
VRVLEGEAAGVATAHDELAFVRGAVVLGAQGDEVLGA